MRVCVLGRRYGSGRFCSAACKSGFAGRSSKDKARAAAEAAAAATATAAKSSGGAATNAVHDTDAAEDPGGGGSGGEEEKMGRVRADTMELDGPSEPRSSSSSSSSCVGGMEGVGAETASGAHGHAAAGEGGSAALVQRATAALRAAAKDAPEWAAPGSAVRAAEVGGRGGPLFQVWGGGTADNT